MKLGMMIVAALALLSPAGAIAQAQPSAVQPHYKKTLTSVVRVIATNRDGSLDYGTGWVIEGARPDRHAGAAIIVSALHTVSSATRVVVIADGDSLDQGKPAAIVHRSPDRDIAFLEVKDLDRPALAVDDSEHVVGERLGAAGYTGASDRGEMSGVAKTPSFKFGGLSKVFRGNVTTTGVDEIEFDAQVLVGYSGGPIVGENGCVVGLTISDGGHLQIANGVTLQLAQGTSRGIAANEIVAAAQDANVEVKRCGTPPPTPSQPIIKQADVPRVDCPRPETNVDDLGHPCLPVKSWWDRTSGSVGGTRGVMIGILILALIGLVVSLAVIMQRRRGSRVEAPPVEPVKPAPGTEPISQHVEIELVTRLGRSIRLTGRGPGNEPIDLRFSREELSAKAKMLGTEGDVVIPDRRPKTFVSRKHALLGYDSRGYFIEDNKSTNRTFLNDVELQPMERKTLASGDRLKLADVLLNVASD